MKSNQNRKEYNIEINNERNFWTKKLIEIFIKVPDTCPYCNKGLIQLRKNESIIYPYLGKSSNYKCNREIYLRVGTIFEPNSKTPASVIYKIIDLCLNFELNASKICTKLKEQYKLKELNTLFIFKILQLYMIYIANYLRDVYTLDALANKNEWNHIAVDECLFTHQDGKQTWVIG